MAESLTAAWTVYMVKTLSGPSEMNTSMGRGVKSIKSESCMKHLVMCTSTTDQDCPSLFSASSRRSRAFPKASR